MVATVVTAPAVEVLAEPDHRALAVPAEAVALARPVASTRGELGARVELALPELTALQPCLQGHTAPSSGLTSLLHRETLDLLALMAAAVAVAAAAVVDLEVSSAMQTVAAVAVAAAPVVKALAQVAAAPEEVIQSRYFQSIPLSHLLIPS